MPEAFYSTAEEVETAFYQAMQSANLEAMMSLWAEDEEIVCVHPTGVRLVGHVQIRESWRQIFSGDQRLQVALSRLAKHEDALVSVRSVYEHICVQGEQHLPAPVVCTNVFIHTPGGWRMVAHHASPSGAQAATMHEGPAVIH